MFQEKKFSFLFVLSILLISVTILLLTNDTIDLFPYLSLPYLRAFSASSSSPPYLLHPLLPSPPITAPSLTDTALSPSQVALSPHDHGSLAWNDDTDGLGESWNMSLNVDWKSCENPDYIPCLDNDKAIKRLKSKKHMEHRERLCPTPPPRCLVPLPKRYKLPLPWPKSRDMVRD